eukprot:GSA25T00001202001.1
MASLSGKLADFLKMPAVQLQRAATTGKQQELPSAGQGSARAVAPGEKSRQGTKTRSVKTEDEARPKVSEKQKENIPKIVAKKQGAMPEADETQHDAISKAVEKQHDVKSRAGEKPRVQEKAKSTSAVKEVHPKSGPARTEARPAHAEKKDAGQAKALSVTAGKKDLNKPIPALQTVRVEKDVGVKEPAAPSKNEKTKKAPPVLTVRLQSSKPNQTPSFADETVIHASKAQPHRRGPICIPPTATVPIQSADPRLARIAPSLTALPI